MYTFIRTEDNARLVIPNEKLASDTITNSTIRSAAKYAEVTVQVPPSRQTFASSSRTFVRKFPASGTRSLSRPWTGRRP